MTWREVAFRLLVALSVPLMVGSVLAHHWPWRWHPDAINGVMGMVVLALGWPAVTSIELVGHAAKTWRRWRHWRGVRRHLLGMGWDDWRGGAVYGLGCVAEPGPHGIEVRPWFPIGHAQTLRGHDAKTTAEIIHALALLMWEQG